MTPAMTKTTSVHSRPWPAVLVTLALSVILLRTAHADVLDWTMTLKPVSTNAISGQTIDLLITFTNNLSEDIFFSDFGDGAGITVDLSGNVIGGGVCGQGVDCFVQNLFITSDDPIDLAPDSSSTFDLGDLILGAHNPGDQIVVTAKGGPDSLPNGAFPTPEFSETTATVTIAAVPEPAPFLLCLLGASGSVLVARPWRGIRNSICRLHPRHRTYHSAKEKVFGEK